MKFGGSHAPNEYQLPSEVLSVLQGKRVQPGISINRPTAQDIKEKPLLVRNPSSNSHINLLKLAGLGLGCRIENFIEPDPSYDIRTTQNKFTPRLEKHRSTQSTSDLRFMADHRFSEGNNPMRISSGNPVGPSNTQLRKSNPLMSSFSPSFPPLPQHPPTPNPKLHHEKTPSHTHTEPLFRSTTRPHTASRPSTTMPDTHTHRQNESDHRHRRAACDVDHAVGRVMAVYGVDGHARVEVKDHRGSLFDKLGYMRVAVQRAQRKVGVYRAEVKHVDDVVAELEEMVQKMDALNRALEDKKKLLSQKKQEYKDVMFIKEAKYKEFKRVKDEVYEDVLEGAGKYSNSYLYGNDHSHRVKMPNIDEIAMYCSVQLADSSDPEVGHLLERLHFASIMLKSS